MVSFIILLLLVGGVFAFMRMNHLSSFDSVYTFLVSKGRQTAEDANTVDIKKYRICNFVDNPDCVYQKDNLDKIGDVNGDGKIDHSDANAYKADGAAASEVDSLKVAAAEKTDYHRADYPHWVMKSGSCDTREYVLKTVGFKTDAKTCKPLSGFTYTEPYKGDKVTDPSSLDIDHVIPLQYADEHGAHAWDAAKKQQFANDTDQLLAVSSSANRSKGDKGPSEWLPQKTEQCVYARTWVTTALKYGISVTQKDKDTLKSTLSSCQ
jgi:hypothetical protein